MLARQIYDDRAHVVHGYKRGHQAWYALADNPRLSHVTYKVKVSDIKLIGKFDPRPLPESKRNRAR